MNKKKWFVLTLAALLLSVFAFVVVALAEDGETPPPFISGDLEPDNAKKKKATATPGRGLWTAKPTAKPTPEPTEFPFNPGLREDHEGHDLRYDVLEVLEYTHKIRVYCKDCKKAVRTYTGDHTLDAEGHCTECTYQCRHDRTYVRTEQADGSKRTWDGEWISYPGTETTICYRCHKVLKYENKIIRRFHTVHINTTTPEWKPNDGNNHYADVTCLDCDTAFRATHYHEFNREAPFTDDGDIETHTHMIVCEDCGYTDERREPHAWVHDSYKKDETDGGGEGHIEVLKCTVCGAKKEEKRPHDAGTHVAYRQEGDSQTHTEVLRCTACGEQFEATRPHELEHDSYRNDGNTDTHIEVLVCTACGQKKDGPRTAHKPMHVGWENVSDTQHRETVICNMCGLTYTLAPTAHTFDGGTYGTAESVYSNGYHLKYAKCSKCGASKKGDKGTLQKHYYTDADSIACILCNQVKFDLKHEHTVNKNTYKIIPLNAEQHYYSYYCQVNSCLAMFPGNYSAHSFDPVTLQCAACGYLKEGCKHQYTYKPVKNGLTAEQHVLIGTCTGCGKEIKTAGAHDMQFASASPYVPCENGHTRTLTYRCSGCGYETHREETENHDFTAGSSISAKEHRLMCSKCGEYGAVEQHRFIPEPDTAAHACYACGERAEHDYFFVEYKNNRGWEGHSCVYQCRGCAQQKEEAGAHKLSTRYSVLSKDRHLFITECTLCGISMGESGNHDFNEAGVCRQCRFIKK